MRSCCGAGHKKHPEEVICARAFRLPRRHVSLAITTLLVLVLLLLLRLLVLLLLNCTGISTLGSAAALPPPPFSPVLTVCGCGDIADIDSLHEQVQPCPVRLPYIRIVLRSDAPVGIPWDSHGCERAVPIVRCGCGWACCCCCCCCSCWWC